MPYINLHLLIFIVKMRAPVPLHFSLVSCLYFPLYISMFISSKYRTHEEKITLQRMKVYLENDYILCAIKTGRREVPCAKKTLNCSNIT